MAFATTVAVGGAAGLHAALQWAYKGSPQEFFLARRFAREPVIATCVAAPLATSPLVEGQGARQYSTAASPRSATSLR